MTGSGLCNSHASSKIAYVPFQSSERNVEEAGAASTKHQESCSSDQRNARNEDDDACYEDDGLTTEGPTDEVDQSRSNLNAAGEAEGQSIDGANEDNRAQGYGQTEQVDYTHQVPAAYKEHGREYSGADEGADAGNDAQAAGLALSNPASEGHGYSTSGGDRVSQTPGYEIMHTSFGSTRASDCTMHLLRRRTCMTEEVPS